MIRSDLVKIFFRSLLISSSLNYRRMQNLGFAYALLPLVKHGDGNPKTTGAFLLRHLQLFNTHPYLSASILGSVARVEDSGELDDRGGVAVQIKNAMMGPYAALGDAFFWGGMRPCAAIAAVAVALGGYSWAPLLFLALYTPFHLWIRGRGFFEGYRLGPEGFRFVQGLNLPGLNPLVRWFSVACLSVLVAWWMKTAMPAPWSVAPDPLIAPVILAIVLMFVWAIKRGISRVLLLYTMAAVFFLVSICYGAE